MKFSFRRRNDSFAPMHPSHIFGVGYRLKMIGIHTEFVQAEMIDDVYPTRDRAFKQNPGRSMGGHKGAFGEWPEPAVAAIRGIDVGLPNPTGFGFFNFRPKALERRCAGSGHAENRSVGAMV